MPLRRHPIARAAVIGGAVHNANEQGYKKAQQEEAQRQQAAAAQQQAYKAGQASVAHQAPPPQPTYAPAPAPVHHKSEHSDYSSHSSHSAPSATVATHTSVPTFSTVTISAPDLEHAKLVASKLVSKRLAASVTIKPAVTTVYFHHEEVCMDEEVCLVVKTRTSLVDAVVRKVVDMSGRGEIPEVVAQHIIGGNPDFFAFILEGTRDA